MQGLKEWHAALARLAQEKGAGYLVSDDPEDHLDAYNEGMSPAEELSELNYSANT